MGGEPFRNLGHVVDHDHTETRAGRQDAMRPPLKV
jgi:hypothetical protein